MTTRTITVGRPDLTLSRMIWIAFGRNPVGYLEEVLEVNPGLANLPILPVGTEVVFPIESLADLEEATTQVVRLWD